MNEERIISKIIVGLDTTSLNDDEKQADLVECGEVIAEYDNGDDEELMEFSYTDRLFRGADEVQEFILKKRTDIPEDCEFEFYYSSSDK
jgi:hypothetical protein